MESNMLTDKQERFCQEYVVDLNSAAAARRAGYSERSARITGHRLLTKDDIRRRISELQVGQSERTQVDADFVVERLRAIADQWQKNPSAATRALELLGRHLDIFGRDSRQQQAAVIPIIQVTLSQPVAERLAAETRPGVQLGELAAPDVA
jgi:phage terminase small subunit